MGSNTRELVYMSALFLHGHVSTAAVHQDSAVCNCLYCISLTQAAGRMPLEVCHLSSLAPACTVP